MSDNAEKPAVNVDALLALVAEKDAAAAELLKELLDSGQAQILTLTEERDQANDSLSEAIAASDSLKAQVISLEKAATEKDSSLTEATGIITGQKDTITGLQAQIVELQTKPAGFPVIEVGKKKYEVQAKVFKYEGKDYTIADLLADKALQKTLVGKGVGFLILKEG
jgi:chromosome segregation ATPase